MELRDVNGDAVYSVQVPAHTQDVVVAHSGIPGCAVAMVQAWDAVKGEGDAAFAECVISHKEKLLNHAEAIYKGGAPGVGDSAIARFEREVARIKSEQDKPVVVAPPAVVVEKAAPVKEVVKEPAKEEAAEPAAEKSAKKHAVHPPSVHKEK